MNNHPNEASIEKLTRDLRDRTMELESLREQLHAANQKLAEERTERDRKENFYRNLLDNSPSLICTHDMEGTIQSINTAGVHLLGRPAEELKGKSLSQLLTPSVRHLFPEYLARIKRHYRDSGLMRIVGRTGDDRILLYNNVIVPDPVHPYVLGNAQDITDLIRLQRSVGAYEERYRVLFEQNPYPTFVYDVDTHLILAVNEAAVEKYGYTKEEFQRLSILDIRPEEDLDDFRRLLATSEEARDRQRVRRHKRKDGTILYVNIKAHPIFFEGKNARIVIVSDLTLSRQAETALRESQERFQLLSLATNDVIWDWNVRDDLVWWNQSLTTLFGYASSELEPGAAGWYNRLHPEDRDAVLKTVYTAIERKQETWTSEYRFMKKDGSYTYVFDRAFLILDESGQAMRMIGSMVDISERKKLEERLLKEKNYLGALHDTAIKLMSRLDLDDVLQTIVARMSELTNLPNAFLYLLDENTNRMTLRVGLGLSTGFYGHSAQMGVGVMGKVWQTGQPLMIEQYQKWPGRSLEFKELQSIGAVPLKSGPRVIGVLGVETTDRTHAFSKEELDVLTAFAELASLAFDNARLYTAAQRELAERIEAENALRKSEEKFRHLFEESKDMFFISSPEGRFTDINPAGVLLFGYSNIEEMTNLNIEQDLYVDIEARRLYQKLMQEQGYVKEFELKLRRKDGEILTVLETATAVYDEHGKTIAYRGVIRDITQLKNLQDQLLQWQKIETIGQLAGGVAHDFNNLLMAILGHCELLQLRAPRQEAILEPLEQIHKAAQAGASLTRQLLAFSRKQVLDPKVVRLNRVLTSIESMVQRLIGEGIHLELELDERTGVVKIDPTQFEQVILNLAGNARDAMPDGGKLIISTQNITLKNAFQGAPFGGITGEFVVITVRDTGFGMDSDTLSHIFEPFFTTKRESHGTGLGLATVYGIVKQSGGYILVDSRVGAGTSFRIYFPRVDLTVPEAPSLSKSAPTPSGQGSILLVDDNESILQAISSFLKMQGYKVMSANSPDLALEMSQKMEGIDLLITDVVMPVMSGPQLAEAIKISNPGVKILFLSGYSDELVRKHGVLDQDALFLQKPASMKDLMKNINTLLK